MPSCLSGINDAASKPLRRVGILQVAAELIWPLQAAAVSAAIAGWVAGAPWSHSLIMAAAYLATALVRTCLVGYAAVEAQKGADTVVADLRDELLATQLSHCDRSLSSGAFAALLVQKLPSLTRYLTRYRPARLRVMIVPLMFVVLTAVHSWTAALIFLIAGPLIPVFMALVGMAAKDASQRQMVEVGTLNTLLVDRLTALADIRLLNAGARTERDFTHRAEALRQRTMEVLRIAFLSSTVLELFSAIGVAMVAVYIGFSLLGEIQFGAWASPLTLQEGIYILLLAPAYFQPLRDLAAAWHDQAEARAVSEEIDALTASPNAKILGETGRGIPLPGPATLEFQDVRLFRSRDIDLPSFSINPGEMVVLTGPSGAGKSSALMAAAGLLPIATGEINVAGHPLDHTTAEGWRHRIAWVPQHIHVPEQSLRSFLDPHDQVADWSKPLAMAHASEIVKQLPRGLAATLGETGTGLSGGEARRMLLARAIAMEADVILADEPTSDLDHETAQAIIGALRDLAQGGATVLVASHDPNLIAAADREVAL